MMWEETMRDQFHDTLPGTSIKKAYDEIWESQRKREKILSKIWKRINESLCYGFHDMKPLTINFTQFE